eukprot:gene5739-6323_t
MNNLETLRLLGSSNIPHNSECSSRSIQEVAPWIAQGGFVLVIIGVLVLFWGLAFICEEYCVPAITVFCKRNKISDDIAGAIFIGTGLSLPVLFASFVGLFISDSAIGVGTVVGGDIFNHLINIAISIFSAPNQTLKLDGTVFSREMAFYLFSCIVVIWAAKGRLLNAFRSMLKRSQWMSCLSIDWYEALILVICYVSYCVVDANFNWWMKWISSSSTVRWLRRKIRNGREIIYSQADRSSDCHSERADEDEEQGAKSEDEEEQDTDNSGRTEGCNSNSNNNIEDGDDAADSARRSTGRSGRISNSLDGSHLISDVRAVDPNNANLASTNATELIEIQNVTLSSCSIWGSHIAAAPPPLLVSVSRRSSSASTNVARPPLHPEVDPNNIDFSNFTMFIRSSFFAAHAIGCIPMSRAWKLRYFTLDQGGLYYRLEYNQPVRGSHVRFIDIFDMEGVEVIDPTLFEFAIRLRTRQKTYYFRAHDRRTFQSLVARLSAFLTDIKMRNESELRAMALKSQNELSQGQQEGMADPDSESIGETCFVFPEGLLPRFVYCFTLPLKVLIFYTTPDVRKSGRGNYAVLSMCVSFVWLALLTYALVEGLGTLADLLHINSSVMGLTVGAWAASYPALWSSIIVAKSGYGDMAVCNALGSNVFSNFIGLGLPWLIYVIVYRKPYAVLEDDGVVLSLTGLMFILVATYILVAATNWTLHLWMVPLFVLVYFGYIVYFIVFTLEL